eukprot:gene4620-4824_t
MPTGAKTAVLALLVSACAGITQVQVDVDHAVAHIPPTYAGFGMEVAAWLGLAE